MTRPNRWLLIAPAAVVAIMLAGVALPQTSTDNANETMQQFGHGAYDEAAQSAETPVAEQAVPLQQTQKHYHAFRMQQLRNKVYFAVLLGGIAVIAHFLVLRALPNHKGSSADIVSATGLIYVIFGTIILVIISTTESQLTASMGILGAVAGYLFGKNAKDSGRGRVENETRTPDSASAPVK
jgi:hypothetical protein